MNQDVSSLAPLSAIEPVSAVGAVTRRLLEHFTSGEIEPGQRLPAERTLATQMGVGRSAVREALAALEVLGVVSVRPGSGTYLRSSVSELLPQTLSWGAMLSRPRTEELIETRSALEVHVARLAAASAGAEQRAAVAAALEEMAHARHDYTAFVEADTLFHQRLGDAAGVPLISDLLTTVRSLLRIWVERSVHDPADTGRTLAEHAAIVRAVEAGDVTAADAAMRAHMRSAANRLLSALEQ